MKIPKYRNGFFTLVILFLFYSCSETSEKDAYAYETHEQLTKKVIGQIAFNNPEFLTVGKPSIIEARLSRNKDIIITDNFSGEGAIKVDSLLLTNRVRVILNSIDDITIEPIEPEEQVLDNESFTVWTWKVVAQSSGIKRLSLKVGIANIDSLNPELPKFIPSKSFNIEAKANLAYSIGNLFKNDWKWILGSVVIPISIFLLGKVSTNQQYQVPHLRAKTPAGQKIKGI